MVSKSLTQENKNHKSSFKNILPRYLMIILMYLIIIFIMVFFISPYSKIHAVSIKGNTMVYDQQVIDSSNIKIGDSVLNTLKKIKNAEKNINKELTQVSKSNVQIKNINQIQIEIEEFETVAYVSEDGFYLRVLENGSILEEEYSVSLGNQPILSKFKEGKTLNLMIEELKHLEKSILDLISEVELIEKKSNPLFVRVYMNNGNEVLASITSFADKILYYPDMVQAVNGKKGVFDMEAGVYFTPFKNKENSDDGIDEDAEEVIEE